MVIRYLKFNIRFKGDLDESGTCGSIFLTINKGLGSFLPISNKFVFFCSMRTRKLSTISKRFNW